MTDFLWVVPRRPCNNRAENWPDLHNAFYNAPVCLTLFKTCELSEFWRMHPSLSFRTS